MAGSRSVVDDLRRSLSGEQLRDAVGSEGQWLESHGVERCAVAADNGTAWVIADLALHLRGVASLPLPIAFTATQRTHAIDDAGIDSVLTDDPAAVAAWSGDWRRAGTSPASGLTLFRREVGAAGRMALPHGTIKVTYTSGSTGAPRGVCLSATQLETVAASLVDATRSLHLQRHLCLLPLSTLLENVAGIYAPLESGASCIVPSLRATGVGTHGVDARALLDILARVRPDSVILVPELLRLLVKAAESGWSPPPTLRFVAVGGAVVTPSLLERAETVGLPVYEGYGLSECASVVCLNTPQARRAGSVGRPLPHVRLRIDDHGEIHVAGQNMLGYVGETRVATDEYATGDLGWQDDDGYVYVRGRKRNLFITSLGRNVSPEWVEAELVHQPAIAQALVHGEARPHPVALIVPSQPGVDAIVIERAIAAANARLPGYAQVRRWLRVSRAFSVDDGLLTANGRLRRDAIERRYESELDDLYLDAIAS